MTARVAAKNLEIGTPLQLAGPAWPLHLLRIPVLAAVAGCVALWSLKWLGRRVLAFGRRNRGQSRPQVAYAQTGSTSFVGTTKGLYRRNDPAVGWRATASTGPILAIAASPVQPQLILAIDQQGRIFRSDTGGISW
jgi:hypothetical protein